MSCENCIALTGDCLVFESESITPGAPQYAIDDVIGTLITLDGVAEANKSGYIKSIEIIEEASTLQKPSFDVFIANEDYTSESDNSPFVMPIAPFAKENIITRYTVDSWTDIDPNSGTKYAINAVHGLNIPFKASDTGTLFLNLIMGEVKTYPAKSELYVRVTLKVNNS
jgi:hypothetical protein